MGFFSSLFGKSPAPEKPVQSQPVAATDQPGAAPIQPTVISFRPWLDSTHTTPDQLKRIASAQKSEVTPDSVDKEAQSCTILGSGKNPYIVTLDHCTCSDFQRRHLPCKHIYRLAAELGIIDLPLQRGVSKGHKLRDRYEILPEAIASLEMVSIPAQQKLAEILSWVSIPDSEGHVVPLTSVAQELRACIFLSSEIMPMAYSVDYLTKADLQAVALSIGGDLPKKSATKSVWAAWVSEHALPEQLPQHISFSIQPGYESITTYIESYLSRKFNNNRGFDVNGDYVEWPCGSSDPDGSGVYEFPDDIVTQLLTQFHCNRCLNGYKPGSAESGKE